MGTGALPLKGVEVKTKEQILNAVKDGKDSQCMDGRDFSRLAGFFPTADLKFFGFELKDGAKHEPEKLTEETVKKQLKSDLEFAFEKALDCRGISSIFMYEVVKMWMWVLDDDLADFDNYTMYGLPLYKAVAVKYGFNNKIGDDKGSESKYEE